MNTKYAPVAPLFQTDAYKLAHRDQYLSAGNVTKVYSNYTNRKSRLEGVTKGVHFGLQAFIQRYIMESFEPFFAAGEDEVARLYAERYVQVIGGDPAEVDVSHIRALHRKGYLPLTFCGVPEGTQLPMGVPSFTVENTDPEFFWLPNYIEPLASAAVWHPSTTATIAHRLRRLMDDFAVRTSDTPEAVDFQGHDFSFRGQASPEAAAASGAGHMLSFTGSDSLISMDFIDAYYDGQQCEPYIGSVPATEHSVMSLGIAVNGEQETFRRLLHTYPSGILSVVSDTFDLWTVLTEYLPALKDEVLARNGKLVIRPDSGKPIDILCGDAETPAGSPSRAGVLNLLWETFGGTINSKGYRVLDSHVGVIYGDSITFDSAREILSRMEQMGYDTTNLVCGVGSFGYQYVTRDSLGSAMKATYAEVDGHGVNLFKNPVTDDGTKRSATGKLAVLTDEHGQYILREKASETELANSVLRPVWSDGRFIRRYTFDEVKANLRAS